MTTRATAGKIGLHLHTGDNAAACVQVYADCAKAGTPISAALVINNAALVNEIKRVSRETFVVGRFGVVGGQDDLPLIPNNPEANRTAGRARFVARYVACAADAYQVANEHYDKAHPAWKVAAMGDFYIGVMEAAEALDAIVLVGDFGVGGPEDVHLPLLAPMLARAEVGGHILNYHGYCKPGSDDITEESEWFAMRWQRIVKDYPTLRVFIGECGGYAKNPPTIMDMLKTYNAMLAPFWQVIGACVFTADAAEPWKSNGCNFDPHLNEYAAWQKSLPRGMQMPYSSPVDPSTNELFANGWFDATGYAVKYKTSKVAEAYHTGRDMNLNTPKFDSDAHAPIYAIADGMVTAVRKYSTWGWIIVIHHTPTGGPHCYARYAHVESILISEGQQIKRGQQIASVGNADGAQPYHLHFDISTTDILYFNPAHWPGLNLAELKEHYADPVAFLRGQVKVETPTGITVYTTDELRLRALPNTACSTITIFKKGDAVAAVEYNASWYKRVAGGYISRQYAKPAQTQPIPLPTPIVVYVTAADGLNVRSGPGTNYAIMAGLPLGTAVTVTAYNDTWYKRVAGGYIASAYTSKTPPAAPTPAWQPPITATMRGLHWNAGGWAIRQQDLDRDLDIIRRNNIKAALIAAYMPGQQNVIAQLRSAGVERFIIRACVTSRANLESMAFINATLPILEQYAAALGGTQDMMIALHNEPNLVSEGWGVQKDDGFWTDGKGFATWFRVIADVYRREFFGCKIGFPAMSPGAALMNARMEEGAFIAGCADAIRDADWIGVHCYWQRPDGSDFNPPISNWRRWFGNKALIGTEIGPADQTNVTADAVRNAYAKCAAIGVPVMAWIGDGAGSFPNASWKVNDIRL